MASLRNYRQVRVTIACDSEAGNIVWEAWTTRTDEQVIAYAMSVGRQVCKELGSAHAGRHIPSIETLPAVVSA